MLYLDNSATTKPYPDVLDTYRQVAEKFFGNPSSLHHLGVQAERLLTKAREQVADLLGVSGQEIIFTSGATEGNNLAIKGAAFAQRHKGKHLITTVIEHPSVSEAFEQLEKEFGFEVTWIPVNENGIVSPTDIQKAVRNDTILVSVMHVNNEIGAIQPIEEIGEILKNYPNIVYHVDHVQGVGKVPLNIKKAGIGLCTISGHKFHALNGTGVLYIRKNTPILTLLSGGGQEASIRSGTENLAGNVSLAKGLRLAFNDYEEKIDRLINTKNYLINELEKIDGIIINTPKESSAPHIINFSVPGIKAEVLVHMLEEKNIYVSTTSACSSRKKGESKVLKAMGKKSSITESAIRISLSIGQTIDDVKPLIDVLPSSIQKLKNIMGL
ncbi:cysteine desulfurase family protein [Aeribacillus composti]|uniref:cysteine desulfurase family protein n=1 Tax=Aeribacillus composti TaxID=1868734 RepID=UPI002E1C5C40|nr:cysteine desulfurase family protein [Aeribacillus composti]